MAPPERRVPVRTIAATIGMVLATGLILLLGWEVRRVLAWIVVAAMLAVILGPVADLAERRLRLPRVLATLLVFLLGLVALAAILTAVVRPIVQEGGQFAERAPQYVEQARSGRGPIGRLMRRYDLDGYVRRNQAVVRANTNRLTERALGVLRSVFSTAVATVTVFVLSFLMVLQGPTLVQSAVRALPDDRRERVRRVAADCARAVTGYVTGNLVISVIAGSVTYVVLWIMDVPYRGVVALFVAFTDLIPLVGATLGAIVAVAVAALHSLPAAIVVLLFFVVYQQIENHVLQPLVMSRAVELSALAVTVAILIGVELLGFLGALLAIPVAAVLRIIARDVYDSYQGRFKPEPTVGADEVPVSEQTRGTAQKQPL